MFRLLLLLLVASPVHAQSQLSVLQITPTGEGVEAGRQIVIKFNQNVVPLGKMEREKVDVTISPKVKCDWRWMDRTSLVCQMGEKDKLVLATRYNVTIGTGIKTEDGRSLKTPHKHSFTTLLPDVRYTYFREWLAPGQPRISVTFNQPVSKASVAKAMTFTRVGGSPINVSVKPDTYERRKARYVFEKNVFIDLGDQNAAADGASVETTDKDVARRTWLVEPTSLLKEGKGHALRVSAGLRSVYGPNTGTNSRVVTEFWTYPKFKFLGITCTNSARSEVMQTDQMLEECAPRKPIQLVFSAPVIKEAAKEGLDIKPDLSGGRKDYDPWSEVYSYSRLSRPHQRDGTYKLNLPPYIKAKQTYKIVGNIKDEFGRSLPAPLNLEFKTGHRLADFKIPHDQAVVESQIDNDQPIYITNIDSITVDYKSLTAKTGKQNKLTKKLGKVKDISFAHPIGLKEILNNKPGAVFGRVSTVPFVGDKGDSETKFFSQNTPWQVLVKYGHFNTLVWVTDLATGKPVAGADIKVFKAAYDTIHRRQKIIETARTDKSGQAYLGGLTKYDPQGKQLYVYGDHDERLMIKVTKGDGFALQPLDYNFQLNTYRLSGDFGSSRQSKWGHMKAWGFTAQGVYKTGEAIQYKILVRNQDNNRFIKAPKSGYTLKILDATGNEVMVKKGLKLNKYGAITGEFTTAKTAVTGTYEFNLLYNSKNFWPMNVLVTDFTPSPFKVTADANGKTFQVGDTVEVTTSARLHSGGPYLDAATRLNTSFLPTPLQPKSPLVKDFYFDTRMDSRASPIVKEGKVDDKGDWRQEVELEDLPIIHGKIVFEAAVKDDRGKFVAGYTSAELHGVNRYVGLKNTAWTYEAGKSADVQFAVIDDKGSMVEEDVDIKIERYETKVSRVKGAGNAFLTKYTSAWVPAGSCTGETKTKQVSHCRFTPKVGGWYRLVASVEDTKGRTHMTSLDAWVVGKGGFVWELPEGHRLDLLPEEDSYKIGDKAKFLVKNPFPGATALITVERYGVLKSWTQTLEGNTPIIEVPIEENYLPGFYLSVAVVSPRVGKEKAFGALDLGKPGFKIGYLKIDVNDPLKRLELKAESDKEVYKPGDKVNLTLSVKNTKAPVEAAVVVLDEAVFDLIKGGKRYYDPYKGFYQLDSLDVTTYNLLTKLIGRQKFAKKGADQGGGGGQSEPATRSLIKYVAYWNPGVELKPGKTQSLSFKLPDNLTGWRVLTVGTTAGERMGLGSDNFKSNRATEIRPVMPNQVTEGDEFAAAFSIMNRTDKERTLRVKIEVGGLAQSKPYKVKVKVAPYRRKIVKLPVKAMAVPYKDQKGEISFKATAQDQQDGDALKHQVAVNKRRSLLTAANYGSTTGSKVKESIQFPKDIQTDVGQVVVSAASSVIGNAEGAFAYMRDYAYSCWEQRLSKGVMASHYIDLKAYISEVEWPEAKEVALQTLKDAASFQAPNGGMAYYTPIDSYVSPYLSAYTALAFRWYKDKGYKVPKQVENKLHTYLKNLLRKDTLPTFYNEGMTSTVRAVALAALRHTLKPSDIKRYTKHMPRMSLFGKAMFLQAASQFKATNKEALKAANLIQSAANQSAGKVQFNESISDSYSRILATPMRSNCAILSSFLTANINPDKDLPMKMVRAITQTRGARDYWENTQENVFCMNALVEYARKYEKTKPNMQVKASLDGKAFGQSKLVGYKAKPSVFSRKLQGTDVGKKSEVLIERQGKGRLYYATKLQYAPIAKFSRRHNAGIELRREYSLKGRKGWSILKAGDQIKRGDLIRSDIYLSIPTARQFVVINDPIPGGLEPVNTDLATASKADDGEAGYQMAGGAFWFKHKDWRSYGVSRWSFYHRELRHNAAIFYSEYLSPGNYHVSYAAQAIATGTFAQMPVHAEEMYDADVFGKGLSGSLKIVE